MVPPDTGRVPILVRVAARDQNFALAQRRRRGEAVGRREAAGDLTKLPLVDIEQLGGRRAGGDEDIPAR